jgi:ribose transport system ATP-binding protein
VGENGAGKSTLLKIMMGVQPQSDGKMKMNGDVYSPRNPKEANANGIGMVFQEQSLITNLTVGQNIFLGKEKQYSLGGLINFKKMYDKANEILEVTNLSDIKPQKYVREYKFADRQMVEIAKVINQAYSSSKEHALILLDEPTSVLNQKEIDQLFSEMRKLASAGHSIIFVSHRLDEVLKITDRIYVFKDALRVAEFETAKTSEKMLYEAIVGRTSGSEYYFTQLQKDPQEEVVLEARNLGLFGTFKDLTFKLYRGEILGFYGVVGSGKEELCSVLCGDIKPTSGEILVNGKRALYSKPSDALNDGVIMIPQERNIEGVVGVLSVADNIAISSYEHLGKWGLVSKKNLVKQAEKWIEKLRIKTPSSKTSVSDLSGGNAQKVMFAKMLSSKSSIVILNHPTRGVDIGAKEEIYQLIRQMIDEGKSIIMLGDTLDECIGMCNRILVMKDGLVTGEFEAPPENKPDKMDIVQCIM